MTEELIEINLKDPVNVELDAPEIPEESIPLKLIISTQTWVNVGSTEMPLWKIVGGKEFLGGFFKGPPTIPEIVEQVDKVTHMFEGGPFDTKEVVSGWQLFFADVPTNSEKFQLDNNGTIDFPPINVLDIDVELEMERIFGDIVKLMPENSTA
jgi:hypothetical protein